MQSCSPSRYVIECASVVARIRAGGVFAMHHADVAGYLNLVAMLFIAVIATCLRRHCGAKYLPCVFDALTLTAQAGFIFDSFAPSVYFSNVLRDCF